MPGIHDRDRDRWLHPDRRSAHRWCRKRNALGIKAVLDILGPYSRDRAQAARSARAYVLSARAIEKQRLKASFAVKLSTLGAVFDRELCRRKLMSICAAASRRKVSIEMDMEGKSLVEFYIRCAIEAADRGYPVTLALQSYLDRTPGDLEEVVKSGVRLRLVKGAYLGDTEEFEEIQRRLKSLASRLSKAGVAFSIGTHDPEIIDWAKTTFAGEKGTMEFGFLKGLSDETKISLAREGWCVAEYVPFGREGNAYISRRLHYLDRLQALGRKPAP
jgi:proline dehydrogenase